MNGRGCKKKPDSLMVLNDAKVDISSLKKGVFLIRKSINWLKHI